MAALNSAAGVLALGVALLLISSSSSAAPAPATLTSIGKPGCKTTCGNVSVPYPFGFGPSHCYWPGLNLTCDDTSRHGPPRLLLDRAGTLQVAHIFLQNSTMRVFSTNVNSSVYGSSSSNMTALLASDDDGWKDAFSFSSSSSDEGSYRLSNGNELVLVGCNVEGMLTSEEEGSASRTIISGCASFCPSFNGSSVDDSREMPGADRYRYCSPSMVRQCCQAPFLSGTTTLRAQVRWLYGGNHTLDLDGVWRPAAGVQMFFAEVGWLEGNVPSLGTSDEEEARPPVILEWGLTRGGLPPPVNDYHYFWSVCSEEVSRTLSCDQNSDCVIVHAGYICQCFPGYDGNPYLAGGCQDINECKLPREEIQCFGECINAMGSYHCRCPPGTHGDHTVRGGCVDISSSSGTAADALLTKIGQPGCNTTCGNVSVPYPFGFGPPNCYWPGFGLTCEDTSSHDGPPVLLLMLDDSIDDGLQVIDILLPDSTVRVISTLQFQWTDDDPAEVDFPDIRDPYMVSTGNDFVFYNCNMEATLLGTRGFTDDYIVISRCSANCSDAPHLPLDGPFVELPTANDYCSGDNGCCHAPIIASSRPKKMLLKRHHELSRRRSWLVPYAFVVDRSAAAGHLFEPLIRNYDDNNHPVAHPLLLSWVVKGGDLPVPAAPVAAASSSSKAAATTCPGDVARRVCRSDNSNCRQENGGYTCYCRDGYHGNPYITGGCQDIDECSIPRKRNTCFGDCNNLPGTYECRCPPGSHGDHSRPGGCVPSYTGLIIGLSVASGPALLLLVLGTIFVLRRIKQRRIKVLKRKYFEQNRGQLLQQLVSQRADIAEKMIIPIDELAKATNNFDKARELGGGGHGVVYKGILSDLHVVAIKKSKISVQNEINEFINEVAILSQINHRNVVKLFGCCLETEVPLLVYEFVSNGTLYHHLHVEAPRSLSWADRLRIAAETAEALAYLHSSVSIPVIHRDVKSSNILIDDTLAAKVSDFGASRYIPVDRTGLTTRVQGTIGYLDPMYFYTGRLTEKSDVYSFGVILVELLTRKKPLYLSPDGEGLVAHFASLLAEGNLVQILDRQVIEEGGEEVQKVAALAASCINLRGEERPTMRQVEHTLEGLQASKKQHKKDNIVAEEVGEDGTIVMKCATTKEGQSTEESSRRYSLEREIMMSASYPR